MLFIYNGLFHPGYHSHIMQNPRLDRGHNTLSPNNNHFFGGNIHFPLIPVLGLCYFA